MEHRSDQRTAQRRKLAPHRGTTELFTAAL
jgi:hypothetical protein